MKKYKFSINGNPYSVTIKTLSDDHAVVDVNGAEYEIQIVEEPIQRKTPQLVRARAIPDSSKPPIKTTTTVRPAMAGAVKAPLPGLILEVMVKEGEAVHAGQVIVRMEAMKMENNIQSNRDGRITKIKVKAGDSVLEGEVLVEIGG
ncbi:biotin/lipoyl-binding protein [candidate division KSB1 bacterium]|nr:biotin/lipoyl-binding protein [candidate division KSB1 bacterium]